MINCIIIDDEPLAVKLLENHISKIDSLKLVATAKNAIEAYQILQTKPVDLMFLDIEMPNLNGIEFLKSLHQKPKTIFTTAYREFAIEGFELEAVDYILKPITFERFFKSVERVLRNISYNEQVEDFIIVKSNGLNRKIILSDLLYFESQGNDVKIILENEEKIVTKNKITDLENSLADKGFVRIHRSFLINSKYVTAFNNNEIILNKYNLPVGRSHKKEFEDFVAKFSASRLL
ncbi:LytR/AlgR family response regulator transcription factor [Epilithonimonas arachidiradicis]|uniref:DNA-binding response regulator n=1 Tax=Epilithonimonas arachidiradicis TaxID=1617282 RepID=A0A420DA75_9FLAO|nr:LytTR family DNA-binding domain-containing protein [Epilithonimonas arachidiradicis]RKE88175.1 LytTR family two component transcriptional regulator [Epilithonimonas arachidiradicis]GGG50768.1 DNA-binding response regulator [Epilithonimonas arachidiradicis]